MQMKWFEGSIADAVNLSKQRNSVFVVYVDGNDELSSKLRRFIDEDRVRTKLESDHFVPIKIDSGSEAYMQFAQIYQLVPLPSIFFIGKSGAPIQVVTGVIASSEELEQKIKIVLDTVGVKDVAVAPKAASESNISSVDKPTTAASATQNFIANEQASNSSSEIVCEGGVCYRRPKTEESTVKPPSNGDNAADSNQIVVSAAKPEPAAQIEEKAELVSDNNLSLEEKPQVDTASEAGTSTAINSTSAENLDSRQEEDIAARVEQAKKLIEEKRKQKQEEEKRLEREREIQRRKQGQDMINFKEMQEKQKLKELKEKIRREKLEEQAARQRVLEKIASDRAEQAKKLATEKPNSTITETVQKSPPPAVNTSSEFSRIQFRKPQGDTNTHTFKSSEKFEVVREYVRTTLLADTAIREFSLAMTYPRREFTSTDDATTLLDLGLCPSAVLLVIAGQRATYSPSAIVARSGGFVNIFNTVFWGLLSPFFAVFGYLRNWITGTRPDPSTTATSGAQKRMNEEGIADNDAAKRRNIDRLLNRNFVSEPNASGSDKNRKDAPYRRAGSNIHRLRESRDSDDENNTWNGNSTQQQ